MHACLAWKGDRYAQAYLVDSGLINTQDFLTLAWARGNMAPSRLPPKPWAARSVGLGTLRSGSGRDAALVLFKAGPPKDNVGHNQRDHLSFQIFAREAWLLGDPGYSKSSQAPPLYRFFEEGFGHSAVIIDGQGPAQKYGASLAVVSGGRGFGLLCGEAAGSYTSGLATSVHRCLALHPDGFVALSDRAVTPVPRRVDRLFQPFGQGFGVIESSGKQARLVSPPGALWVVPVGSPAGLSLRDVAQSSSVPHTVVAAGSLSGTTALALQNPGFEQATFVGWTPRSTTSSAHTLNSAAPRSGKQAARISFAKSDAGYFYSQRLTVGVGDRFWAAVYLRAHKVTGSGARLRLIFWKKGAYLGDLAGQRVTGDWAWHERVVQGKAPAGADQVSVALELSGSGTVWFDDVALRRVTAGQQKPSTSRFSALLQPSATPYLVNGDFSVGLTTWTPRSTTASGHSTVTDVTRSKPRAARIHFPSTAQSGYFYGAYIPVTTGDAVTAEAWIKTQVASGSGARLRLLFFNTTTYQTSQYAAHIKGTAGWTRQTVSATVPTGCNRLRIALEFSGQGTVWFDDVTFANATHPVPTAQRAGPSKLTGGATAYSFVRGKVTYTVLDALYGPLSATTTRGKATLDAGVAILASPLWSASVMVGGTRLTVSDGTKVELDRKAAVRLAREKNSVAVELSAHNGGKAPTRALVELPGANGVTAATVNNKAATTTALAGGRVRICWGMFSSGPCAVRFDGGVPPDRAVASPDRAVISPDRSMTTPDGSGADRNLVDRSAGRADRSVSRDRGARPDRVAVRDRGEVADGASPDPADNHQGCSCRAAGRGQSAPTLPLVCLVLWLVARRRGGPRRYPGRVNVQVSSSDRAGSKA